MDFSEKTYFIKCKRYYLTINPINISIFYKIKSTLFFFNKVLHLHLQFTLNNNNFNEREYLNMKKIVNLLSGISLIGSSWPMVNANSSYNPQVQILNRSKRQGNFKALNEEIKNWILGELVDNLPETILKKIYKLNKKIKKNSLRIINVRGNVARIIWDEDVDSKTNFTNVYFTVYDSSNSVFYNDNPSLGTCQSLASTSSEETNKNQIE